MDVSLNKLNELAKLNELKVPFRAVQHPRSA